MTVAYEALDALLGVASHERAGRSLGVGVQSLVFKRDGGKSGVASVVRGSSGNYACAIVFNPRGFRCTCPDSQQRGRQVGPCKHVIATANAAMEKVKVAGADADSALESLLERAYIQLS